MIAIIFEVEPHEDSKQQYLDIAADLKPMLQEIDGFISVERFQSLTIEGKILSLSFFRDEQSVQEWRALQKHREAQSVGRSALFKDYRIRVASVLRDYSLNERDQAPSDSTDLHG